MSRGIKILLIVLAFLVVAVIAIAYFSMQYLTGSMEAVNDEVVEFVKTADKEQCVDEIARKQKGCEGMTCMASNAMFSVMCLDLASGSKESVCGSVPASEAEFADSEWKIEKCDANGLSATSCQATYKFIGEYCKNPQQ